MISNETQYRKTKGHLATFDEALANLEARAGTGKRSKLAQLEIDAVRAQADDLRAELAEYEKLRTGTVSFLEADSLAGLGAVLIRARLARGWTQRQLADALGVAEQQIQRYESTAYRSASLARLCDVADALSVTITERAKLDAPPAA